MNKFWFGRNWIGFLREAEGVDGGGASDGGTSGTETGEGAAAVVAGEEAAAPASTFLTEGKAPAEGEAKPAEGETKAAEGEAPAAFDIAAATLPEGVAVNEELGKSFSEILSKPDLTPQERGQQLMDLHVKALDDLQKSGASAFEEAGRAAWTKTNDDWREEIKALPEFKNNPDAEAGKMLQAFTAVGADEKFFAALDLTGAGNNPAIVQVLHRLAQPFLEGGAVSGDGKAASTKRLGDNIYTSTARE